MSNLGYIELLDVNCKHEISKIPVEGITKGKLKEHGRDHIYIDGNFDVINTEHPLAGHGV